MQIGSSSPVNVKTSVSTPMAIPYRTGDLVVVQALKVLEVANATDVILKFPNGETLSTIFQDRFSGKEGDFFTIKIQSKTDKQVFAEIIRNQDGIHPKKNGIINFLTNLNIANTPQNYQVAMQMIKSGIDKTNKQFNSITQLMEQYPELTLDQIVFMIKKEIPFSEKTTSTVASLTTHENLIGEELLLLFQLVMGDDDKRKGIIKLLKDFYKNPDDKNFDFSQLKTDKTIGDLVNILQTLKEQNVFGERTKDSIGQFSKNTEAQLEVMQRLNPSIVYLQIPLNTNGYYGTAELYLLDDEKSNNDTTKQKTIFLRIPTSNLGLVELFLHIDNNNSLQCHFNTEEIIDIKHINTNIMKLYEVMGAIGYNLVKLTYNEIPAGISIDNFKSYAELIGSEKKFDERI